jgi:sugar phosphate isomerase/epimerase
MAMENHQDLTAPELISVIQRVNSEQLGVCYDTGNSLAVLEDPILTAEQLAPYAFTTHFKNCAFAMSPYGTNITHTGLGRGLCLSPESSK